MADQGWRASLLLALLMVSSAALAQAPGHARKQQQQQPVANDWLGKRVVQRYNNFPLRLEGQAVMRSGMEIHIYRVVRADGQKLWLEGEKDGPSGWATADQFVRLEDALTFLADRIRAQPGDAFYHAVRAAIHADRNEHDRALDEWKTIVELEPDDAASYIGRGRARFTSRDLDQAIADFSQAIKIDPDDAYSYLCRGLALSRKKEFDKAIDDYNQAILKNADDPELYYNRAWAWQQKGDRARAMADYAKGVSLDPDREFAPGEAGPAAADVVDQKKAIDDFLSQLPLEHAGAPAPAPDAAPKSKQLDVVPASFDPIPAPKGDDRRRTTDVAGQPRAAGAEARAPSVRDFFGIIEPRTAHDFIGRGGDWLRIKQYDKAIADCTEAIDLGSHDPLARTYRGLAWFEKKEYDKAIADYDDAIRLDPQNAFAFFARSAAWSSKKEHGKADADLAVAFRLDPQSPVTCNGRAWSWATCPDAKHRDGHKAVEAATKACELTDWLEGGIIDTLAAAYAEVGDFASAVKWQTRAIELETDAKDKGEFVARLKLYQDKKPYRDIKP